MADATFFSIDVAVAKARNVAYYADAGRSASRGPGRRELRRHARGAAGVAFTNRTFRYLATPFFPTGVDGSRQRAVFDPQRSGHQSQHGREPRCRRCPPTNTPACSAYDAFNPGTNFRELNDPGVVVGNQNGVVFFPGSTPLYKNGALVGGFGVSGDGVDQDDVVTFGGGGQFLAQLQAPASSRADEIFVRGVRLPFQKFSRNPHA